ncbi:MAG TPA: hypothetical protein VGC22_07415 [Chitinophaga sp.]
MRTSTFAVAICFFFISCNSTKSYQATEFKRISTVYHTTIKPDPDKPVPSRKALKKNLEEIERYVALIPDSLVMIQYSGAAAEEAKIDSFYTRSSKISYIRKHGLETPHKIFVE